MEPVDHASMMALAKGRYTATFAISADEVAEAQELRGVCFGLNRRDVDGFDASCSHVLIRRTHDHHLVACFRMLAMTGTSISTSYCAQFYDLEALVDFAGPMVELGRFCIHPSEQDPDILRVAWAAMTAYVDQNDVKLLFGCTSFVGSDAGPYKNTFALLGAQHLAPNIWLPKVKAAEVVHFERSAFDMKQAMSAMPALLRTYLVMGGWVSDHAVVDRQLNTLHVFTGVEIDLIPDTRKRLLRAALER